MKSIFPSHPPIVHPFMSNHETRPKKKGTGRIIFDHHLESYQQCCRDVNNQGFYIKDFFERCPELPKDNAHMAIAEQAVNKKLFLVYLENKGSKARIFLDSRWAKGNGCQPPPPGLGLHSGTIRVLIEKHDKGIDRSNPDDLYFERKYIEYVSSRSVGEVDSAIDVSSPQPSGHLDSETLMMTNVNDRIDRMDEIDEDTIELTDDDFEFDWENGTLVQQHQPSTEINQQPLITVRKYEDRTEMDVYSTDVTREIVCRMFANI
jgi:hypothetical protein